MTLPNDISKCRGKGCGDREACARWWEHHPKSHRHQWVAAFDEHREKQCEYLIKSFEPKAEATGTPHPTEPESGPESP